MKYAFAVYIILTLFSCNKPSSPTPPQAQDTLLVSLTHYQPLIHRKVLEIFSYDQIQQLASIHGYTYDTSSGTPVEDSLVLSFAQTSGTIPPVSYDLTFFMVGNPPAGAADHHLLFYDNQNRVIRDSIGSSTANGLSTQHYLYDNNGNITVNWLFPDSSAPGGYGITQIDTISTAAGSVSMNINYSTTYAVDGSGNYVLTSESFNQLDTYSYSTYINPLYQPALSGSLGALMLFNQGGDYLSKYLPNQWVNQASLASPQITLNYSWTINSAGKVIHGEGIDSNSGIPVDMYDFTY